MPPPRKAFSSLHFSGLAFTLGAAALALLGVAGCHPAVSDPQDPRYIVAEKPKAWAITRAELDTQIDLILRAQHQTRQQIDPAKMPVLETKVLDSMVLRKLLLDRAAQLHIPEAEIASDEATLIGQAKAQSPNEQAFEQTLNNAGLTLDAFKKLVHEQVLVRRALQADAIHDPEPTEQEINDFYLAHQDKFVVQNKLRASRIVIMVDDKTSPEEKAARKKAIDRARARVMKGEDFGKVASEVSEDRYSAPKGGDIGYFQKGENEDDFDAVAFNTKPGVVSPVFQTPMGYQFLKITDVQPGGELSIAQVRDLIAQHLREDKVTKEEDDYADSLPAKNGVIFHLVHVDVTAPPPGAENNGTPAADGGAASSPPNGTAPAPSR